MTERLLEIGKRILEHNHRLALLPQQLGLPPAYAALLLDPADLLASAWGALFTATDSAQASKVMRRVERHSVHSLAERPPLNDITSDITSAPRVPDSPAASTPHQRKAVRLQPTQPPSSPARPDWSVKSHWPLSLVSRTSKQVAYSTQQRAPIDERTKGDFTLQPDASLTTRTSSGMPSDSPLPSHTNLLRAESSSHILRASDLSPAPALPVTPIQTIAAVSPEEVFSSREESLTPTIPATDITAALQDEEARIPSGNFTHNLSSPPSVLNANPIADTSPPAVESSSSSPSHVPIVAFNSASAPPDSKVQTRAVVSPAELFTNPEATLTPPASTTRVTAKRQQEEEHRAEAHLEASQLPGINFSPNSSSLASVLNANLIAAENAPAHAARLETPGVAQRADALSNSFRAHDRSSIDARDASLSHSFEARDRRGRENRPEEDSLTQGHDAPLVEALLEELYERLRLEFLRTYGTSGE